MLGVWPAPVDGALSSILWKRSPNSSEVKLNSRSVIWSQEAFARPPLAVSRPRSSVDPESQ